MLGETPSLSMSFHFYLTITILHPHHDFYKYRTYIIGTLTQSVWRLVSLHRHETLDNNINVAPVWRSPNEGHWLVSSLWFRPGKDPLFSEETTDYNRTLEGSSERFREDLTDRQILRRLVRRKGTRKNPSLKVVRGMYKSEQKSLRDLLVLLFVTYSTLSSYLFLFYWLLKVSGTWPTLIGPRTSFLYHMSLALWNSCQFISLTKVSIPVPYLFGVPSHINKYLSIHVERWDPDFLVPLSRQWL